ncbi:conserved hypothetical protein [Ricinus communis]|uniref:Uncharacterized protein n=1 Tax=Ricinus communis TaxID=3988 RepID=B9S4B2_RICCO|nr:conserved hypothetical protein [Ricinus communis]
MAELSNIKPLAGSQRECRERQYSPFYLPTEGIIIVSLSCTFDYTRMNIK